jgi:nicotinamide-nucleotide amidase
MTAEIITIGDELLIGQVVNTNQAFIADRLADIGIPVTRMITVADELAPILEACSQSWARAGVIILTGGLGPTHDDVTKKALCAFFSTELQSNEEVRRNVERLLQARNAPWSPAAEEQTMFPAKAKVVPNRLGTAAGILFEQENKLLVALPGVPYEMTAMVTESLIPLLRVKAGETTYRQLTLRTTGISESNLAKTLGDLDQLLEGAKLAFLPSPGGVRLRITVHEPDPIQSEKKLIAVEQRIREKATRYIYGSGSQELEEVVGKLLARRRLMIAVAESCTGGLIADMLTNVSGSSAYFERGVIAYSNSAKTALLGVWEGVIREHGAVSREVAEQMASGIRANAGTAIGLSTTGIAGPAGATPGKPVGLVWIGYSDAESTLAIRFQFGNDRRRVKERAAAAALELVRRKVLKLEG